MASPTTTKLTVNVTDEDYMTLKEQWREVKDFFGDTNETFPFQQYLDEIISEYCIRVRDPDYLDKAENAIIDSLHEAGSKGATPEQLRDMAADRL